jgi:hypothetical protein
MDSRSGYVGTFDEVSTYIKKDGRDPMKDMILLDGPDDAVKRVSQAVAAHKPNRKARRKAQRAARKRNR